MIGAAHRKINSNQSGIGYSLRIERRWPGVVTHSTAHPTNPIGLRFLNRQLSCLTHHQMPHCVIAINQCGCAAIMHDPNGRSGVDSASTNSANVLGQTENSVAICAI